ncbi:hypothetical protein RLOC_00013768 [Lonchura striata]|uniref:Uncharacterized protein n=1 Tax=Lonchura striata TaxID=40157 RepID=A0A218UP28_9PASE|nr:hypothetical protein RLOC_00013768 [Lonchura striata domestica]
MGRHRFSPVKEVTLLFWLLMLSTGEKIPDSYTILFTDKSQSSSILQATRSEGFSLADYLVSCNCTTRDKIQMVMDVRACGSLQGNFSYSNFS